MEYNATILKILNIEKSEVKYVLWTALYSFFLGTAIAFFFTGSTALFLNIFNKEMIPLSFIIAGIIVIGVGQAYSYLQQKFQFSFTAIGALAFLLVSVIVFFVLYSAFESIVIIFALYAWNRIIAYIHNVVFWGMAGKLFSIQQAKRVFGLISGGEVLGLIVAFFSIPVLLTIINTEDLLIISGITLFIGFLILIIISRKFSPKMGSTSKKKVSVSTDIKIKKTSFLQNRYYGLFFIIAFIPIFVQFFVDFIFQAQLKIEYPGKEELTAFVGIFFGFGAIVEFILKTFISGRLMSRYGMKFGLLAFPVLMAFSFVLASLFGFIYGAVSLFFSFVALGRLFTRAVRSSFNDPATQLLYQPLPAEERVAFQNKVESGPKAYASIVAGVLLFLFAKIPGISLVYFSAFLLLVIIIWAKSADEIYKEYRNVLQLILSGKKKSDTIHDKHPLIEKISMELESGNVFTLKSVVKLSRVIIPFETNKFLENSPNVNELAISTETLKFSKIIELSKSENPFDRIIAVRQMHKFSIYKVEKPLIRLLHDENFEVKCEAIISCSKLKETELFYHLVSLFQNPEFKITVSNAIIHIGEAILPEMDNNFQKSEYDIGIQITTIELFEQIGGAKVIDFFKRNINHHNKAVSDRIIQALGVLKYVANGQENMIIWQKLENEIKNYVFVTAALYNLRKHIEAPELFNALELEKQKKKDKIFSKLSVLYDPYAVKLIAENLETKDRNAHGFALEVAEIVFSDIHKPVLLPLLESEDDAVLLQRYMLYYPTENPGIIEQLIDIINSEYWVIGLYAKANALKLLAGYKHPGIFPILMANIVHPKPMMWQLSAFCIYKIDKTVFEKEINQNFPKVPGLKEFADDIELFENGSKSLIYDKLERIKSLPAFDKVAEDDLIEISASIKTEHFDQDKDIIFKHKPRNYIIILSGGLIRIIDNKLYEQGDILCPYLLDENNEYIYRMTGDKCSYISVHFHLINNLILKNKEFAKQLLKILWKENESKRETNQTLITNGIINA